MPRIVGLIVIVALWLAGCGSLLHRVPAAGATASPVIMSPAQASSPLLKWQSGAVAPALPATPPATATPRRYWHWRLQTGGAAALTNERWVGVAAGAPTYFVAGGAVHQADPADWGAHRFMVEGRAFTYPELIQVPADPTGMSAFLSVPYHTTEFTPRIFDEAIELAIAPTPPAALVAAYEAISRRPEVHYAGRTVDALGRPAIALVFEFDGMQNQLLVDPRTGAALSRRAVPLGGGPATIGTIVQLAEWTDTAPA